MAIDVEIKRLEAIRDDESKPIDERFRAGAELFRLLESEMKRAQKAALALYWKKIEGVK